MIVITLPDIPSEHLLLKKAKESNQDALRAIYESYFPPVFQFIRLRVNDREVARDIAADVFVDLFVALQGKHSLHTSLRAWLFRVARNKIYDHYGEKKRFAAETLDEWTPLSTEEDLETEFLNSLQVERIRSTMNMLADEQQEVLILRFGQGLSLQETADLMDKTVSAIKSIQFRATETLRVILHVGEAN